jgi:tRNA(Ile)-lysidine synthase
VLVACSGGADSLALAAATAFVAPRLKLRAGLVSVDHGLQPGSGERAVTVAEWGRDVGLSPSIAVPVVVAGPGGPEAAARDARYRALARAARDADGALVLLGHTRDDQAETVLLALARGAGPRGLAAMPPSFVRHGASFVRPFLDLTRATAAQLCAESGLTPWQDPHNTDPSYARARVRAALPVLVEALGRDLVDNLARTARLVAADLTALDELAEKVAPEVRDEAGGLRVEALAALTPAVRGRVLRGYTQELGVSGGALSAAHLDALDALVTAWHGQGPVALPGGIRIGRVFGCLRLVP